MEDVAGASRSRRAVAWLLPALWAGGLLLLSAQPARRLPSPFFWQADKLVHASLYFALGGLVGRALSLSAAGRWAVVAAAVALVGFGVFDEWTQEFSPGRSAGAPDALADAVGSLAGLFAASRYDWRRHGTPPQLRR